MYIAREEVNGETVYSIRETYSSEGALKSRTLFNLGPDPSVFIHYPGGNSYYIDERIELSLMEKGIETDTFEIEDLFLPFLDARLRRVLRPSQGDRERKKWKRLKRSELLALQSRIHIFDRRRLHYLRFGTLNQAGLEETPHRFFTSLIGKSREEIECLIDEGEQKLRKRELKRYTYVIFDLQRHFPGNFFALRSPRMLDQERLDGYFLDALCDLNNDRSFLDPPSKTLNPYLRKYLSFYFDNEFASQKRHFNRDEFNRRHYRETHADKAETLTIEEACRMLDLSPQEFRRMSRRQLVRKYRHLAHKCHPDKGGSHDRFILLCRAYERLLQAKPVSTGGSDG
jgi:hypothetical protein